MKYIPAVEFDSIFVSKKKNILLFLEICEPSFIHKLY